MACKLFRCLSSCNKTCGKLTLDDRSFIPDPNHPPDLNAVKEACLAVDVLGEDYR